jgi:hypothetical protein
MEKGGSQPEGVSQGFNTGSLYNLEDVLSRHADTSGQTEITAPYVNDGSVAREFEQPAVYEPTREQPLLPLPEMAEPEVHVLSLEEIAMPRDTAQDIDNGTALRGQGIFRGPGMPVDEKANEPQWFRSPNPDQGEKE